MKRLTIAASAIALGATVGFVAVHAGVGGAQTAPTTTPAETTTTAAGATTTTPGAATTTMPGATTTTAAGVTTTTTPGATTTTTPGATTTTTPGATTTTEAGATTTTTPPPTTPVMQRVLPLDAAQKLAAAALSECASRGFAVTVAVVDRDGVDLVVLRADGTTGATVDVARGKAYAAAGFQSPTAALQERAKTDPALAAIPKFVILAGGEPIRAGTALLGGVGVSGAPSGTIDDDCAKAGLTAIAFSLT